VAPDDVLEHLDRALIGLERSGDRLDGPGRNVVSALDQLDQLVDDRLRRAHIPGLALEREHIAAQVELAPQLALE
jgi:hypothetical protein